MGKDDDRGVRGEKIWLNFSNHSFNLRESFSDSPCLSSDCIMLKLLDVD